MYYFSMNFFISLLNARNWLVVISVVFSPNIMARVTPADNSILTQVHIMFEWNEVLTATRYELEIAEQLNVPGKQKLLRFTTPHISKLVTAGLGFGAAYRWRVLAFTGKRKLYTGNWLQFRIAQSAQVMPDSFRTEIISKGQPGSDIVFLDHSAMAINRNGNPVWFMPVPTDSLSRWNIRDLRLTPGGTITHLDANGAYEKNLQGALLWRGPDDGRVSGGRHEFYHHQLEKNTDGSYTVCGSQYKNPGEPEQNGAARYNTLIVYEPGGPVKNSWSELAGLQKDALLKPFSRQKAGGHLNGFAQVPGTPYYFLSFKNYSAVFLLNMQSQKLVTGLQGGNMPPAFGFLQQHGPFLNKQSELMIYNNNILEKQDGEDADKPRHPSIIIFRFDTVKKELSPVWNYTLQSARFPEGIMGKEGYVSETAAGNLLVCAGGVNYAAEITRSKQKIWECFFYKRTTGDSTWKPYSNYRCRSVSSLYPLYYTVQYTGKQKGNLLFRFYNSGSEPGSFRLVFSREGNAVNFVVRTENLQPGAETIFRVPEKWAAQKNVQCEITPEHISAPAKMYRFPLSGK